MAKFNKTFSPEIVKHMNYVSDLENNVSTLECVLRRAKIDYAIAENKERVFESKKDKLQDTLKLLLYNVAKQNSLQTTNNSCPVSIHTYIDFLENKIKILKQEIQQVECDISTSEQNIEESVAALKDLLAKIENCLA